MVDPCHLWCLTLDLNHRAVPDRTDRLTQPMMNVGVWLNHPLDAVATQLAWVLLPPLTTGSSWRLTATAPESSDEFEAIIRQLLRQGMQLPPSARSAYRDLRVGAIPSRLYLVAGVLATESSPPHWSLLVVLGPQPGTHLPDGMQLSVSDGSELLVQRSLAVGTQDDYLFAQLVGTWAEIFVVTITSPQGTTLVLPPFTFQPEPGAPLL